MKGLLPLFLLGFGIALAVIIGNRMSSDAMAVVVGVAVGVVTSVPTSLLLVALLRRQRHDSWATPPPQLNASPQPPVFVLPQWPQQPTQQTFANYLPMPSAQDLAGAHPLRVIGDRDE